MLVAPGAVGVAGLGDVHHREAGSGKSDRFKQLHSNQTNILEITIPYFTQVK